MGRIAPLCRSMMMCLNSLCCYVICRQFHLIYFSFIVLCSLDLTRAQAWVGHRRWLYILWRHCSHHGNYFCRCRSAISGDLENQCWSCEIWVDLDVFVECHLGVPRQIGHLLKSDRLRSRRNAENAEPKVHCNLTLSTFVQIQCNRQTTLSQVWHRSVTPWPDAIPAIPVSEVALKSWGVQATTASLTQSRSEEHRSGTTKPLTSLQLHLFRFKKLCSEIHFCCYTITQLDHVRAEPSLNWEYPSSKHNQSRKEIMIAMSIYGYMDFNISYLIYMWRDLSGPDKTRKRDWYSCLLTATVGARCVCI